MIKKITLLILACLSLIVITIKITGIDKSEKHLNYFAKYYFDEQYYVNTYPEVANHKTDPFEHYVTTGWKEGKNPNSEFESTLYSNLYLLYVNKYKLNPLAHYFRSKISLKNPHINILEFKKAQPLENPKYYLALVAIFRDEAPYLKEWIEFYRLLGVEHFYLHNHLSTDNFAEVLKPYIDAGIVDLNNITTETNNLIAWNKIQTKAYFSTISDVKDFVEWLVVVDTDEFLFPIKEKNLAHALKDYDQYAGLSVNWRIFGSSNIDKIPSNKLLIETLIMKGDATDTQVKTIVKPRYVKDVANPHYPKFKKGYAQVTENFEYFNGPFIPKESRQIFRINHYWSRNLDFFYNRKISRVHVVDNKIDKTQAKAKIKSLLNQDKQNSLINDNAILKYTDELRSKLFEKNALSD